jgi:hypothetical protein
MLQQEVKDLKEKFYGKVQETDARKRSTFQEDLVAFVQPVDGQRKRMSAY